MEQKELALDKYKKTFDFCDTLDKYMEDGSRYYRLGDTSISFWPTEASAWKKVKGYGEILIGKGCNRKIWYRIKGYEPTDKMKSTAYHRAELGNRVEAYVIDYFRRNGRVVSTGTKFFNEQYNISGKLDIIFKDDNSSNAICEMKSIYGYYANKEVHGYTDRKRIKHYGQPKEDHLLQAFVYNTLLCGEDKDLKYTKIVYISRDDAQRTEFDIHTHEEKGILFPVVVDKNNRVVIRYDINGSSVFERYEGYNLLVGREDPPPRDFQLIYERDEVKSRHEAGLITDSKYNKWKSGKEKLGDFQCSYCSHKSLCYGLK